MPNLIKTKEDVLGQVIQPKIKGGFDIDEEKLKEPLYYEGSVARCFCFGCGTSTELVKEGAEHLAQIVGAGTPALWEGLYFVSEECITCGKDFKNAILKKA